MNTTTCKECGHEIQMGQYPWCSHGWMAGREPQQFQPIVVHRRIGPDGQHLYSYPGNASDPVDAGYEKVELTTMAMADRFVKERGREEQELRSLAISGERDYWNDRAKERREIAREQLQKQLGKSSSRIGDLVARAMDARREKKYRELASRPVEFHNQALSYDSRNRAAYSDGSRKISVVVQGSKR